MVNQGSKQPRTRSLLTGLILSVALLVALNLVSNFFFYRLDLSKGKIHTLSPTSKNLVRKLNDNVVAKVYLSANLPPDYNVMARYARDLLGEYKQYGGRHFRFEYVSTANEDEFRGQAARDNIITQRTMILENDQQTVRDIYMGIAFEYKGNRESINLTKSIEGRLEYEITSLLRRLTKANLPKVAIFQDSLYSSEYYKYMEHHLYQNYNVIPTNLTAPVMATDVLIFPGVADSILPVQLYNLDQYIMHGGKVIFLQDRVTGLVQYNRAYEIQSNLFRLLDHYGVEIKPNLVMDQNCAPINMSQRSGIFVIDTPVPFPPIPLIQGIKNNAVSNGLSDIILYLPSEINTNVTKPGLTITPLLKTSPNSGVMNGPDFDISPERFMQEKITSTLNMPPITVSALYTGSLTSLYADNPKVNQTPGFIARADKAELILVSDADLVRDFVASASDTNIMFLLNAIDFLLKDISLSEVRSRTLPNSPLEISSWLFRQGMDPERIATVEPRVRQTVKGINLVLPSFLLLLYGFRRMLAEKKRRRDIQNRFMPLKFSEPETPPSIPTEPEDQS